MMRMSKGMIPPDCSAAPRRAGSIPCGYAQRSSSRNPSRHSQSVQIPEIRAFRYLLMSERVMKLCIGLGKLPPLHDLLTLLSYSNKCRQKKQRISYTSVILQISSRSGIPFPGRQSRIYRYAPPECLRKGAPSRILSPRSAAGHVLPCRPASFLPGFHRIP